MDFASGRWYVGIDAVRQIALRVPLYWPLAPAVSVSIRLGFGPAVYHWISTHRRIVPVGHCEDGTCPLPNQGKRRGLRS
jgi:hypothetical protein